MIFFITLSIVLMVNFFLICKITKKKNIQVMVKIIAVVILIEIYIFNINSFRVLNNKHDKKVIELENMILEGIEFQEDKNSYLISKENASIEIKNINTNIRTIKLDVKLKGKLDVLTYNIEYTDETSENYRELPKKILVNDIERSKYTACYLSGKSEKIKIQINNMQNKEIQINNIIINEMVPIDFSIIRCSILFFIILSIYMIKNNSDFSIPYNTKNENQKTIIIIVMGVFITILIWQTIILGDMKFESEYSEIFTNALINKQVHLEVEPDESLINLKNPYDQTARKNINYLWDVAYYKENYYIYFGILPALILFVPFKLITGEYLSMNIGIFLFSIWQTIITVKLMLLIYKKWFNKTAFRYLILAITISLFGSLILWINGRPDMYELFIVSGACFAMQGLYFIMKWLEREKVEPIYLLAASIFLALSVACRPNLLIMSMFIIPILIYLIKTYKDNRENTIKSILYIATPYMIIGVLCMVYNYIRFDNIFEFGSNYQLTVNDIGKLENRIATIPVGIFTAFFMLPSFTTVFPFYNLYNSTLNFFGYYYVENIVCGLFILNPICWIIFFTKSILKRDKKNKEKKIAIYTAIAIVAVLVITTIMKAGTLQRYAYDYIWLLITVSCMLVFQLIDNIKDKNLKRYILNSLIIIAIITVFSNFIVGAVVSENELLRKYNPKQYYDIRYSICFWE